MNFSDDSGDDYYTCEGCGKKNYPEVGMAFCDCGYKSLPSVDLCLPRKPSSIFNHRNQVREITSISAFMELNFPELESTNPKPKKKPKNKLKKPNLDKLRLKLLDKANRDLVKNLILSDGDYSILDLVKQGDYTSSGIAKQLKISVASAGQRLDRIHRKGYLSKTEYIHPTGGIVYVYRLKHKP